MLTRTELDAIRERVEALEPEEWEAYFTIHCDPFVSVKGFPKTHFRVSTAPADYGRSTAIFIAHARRDIPALLAHIAELEAKLAAFGEALGKIEELVAGRVENAQRRRYHGLASKTNIKYDDERASEAHDILNAIAILDPRAAQGQENGKEKGQ